MSLEKIMEKYGVKLNEEMKKIEEENMPIENEIRIARRY